MVNVTPEDRRELEAIAGDRNAPQKHVWRAKIILATADGCGTTEITRRSGKAKPVVGVALAGAVHGGRPDPRQDSRRCRQSP